MRLIQLTVAVVVTLCSVTVHVPSAWADNTTCANAVYLFPGEVASDALPPAGGTPGYLYFKTAVVAGRSYSVAAWAPWTDPSQVAGGPQLTLSLHTNTCTSAAGSTSLDHSEPDIHVTNHLGDRVTIVPDFTGPLWIRVGNLKQTSYFAHVRMVETTLFSPWWFTGGTNQAFAEIRNTTNANVGLRATFVGSDGAVCGSTLLTLPANGNTAVSVGTLGTCKAVTSGSAQIAFWGAPGAVAANITTIDGVQATSFDSPFTPRMVWGVSRR